MAQKIETILEDDLTGEPADETLSFGLDGKSYSIDLTADNAQELREIFNDYIIAARLDSAGTSKKPAQHRSDPNVVKAIRTWAAQNDVPLAARGRIPHAVVSAYQDAQQAA